MFQMMPLKTFVKYSAVTDYIHREFSNDRELSKAKHIFAFLQEAFVEDKLKLSSRIYFYFQRKNVTAVFCAMSWKNNLAKLFLSVPS